MIRQRNGISTNLAFNKAQHYKEKNIHRTKENSIIHEKIFANYIIWRGLQIISIQRAKQFSDKTKSSLKVNKEHKETFLKRCTNGQKTCKKYSMSLLNERETNQNNNINLVSVRIAEI